jgi:hypothetical protein
VINTNNMFLNAHCFDQDVSSWVFTDLSIPTDTSQCTTTATPSTAPTGPTAVPTTVVPTAVSTTAVPTTAVPTTADPTGEIPTYLYIPLYTPIHPVCTPIHPYISLYTLLNLYKPHI